ncbi:MAG: helix-turn-helix domain-containing protein [Candidatus Binatia bacterium]
MITSGYGSATFVADKQLSEDFQERFKKMFDFASMAEIARIIEVPHATVRNYFAGRLPAPEVLIKIANATNISLNWLLLGQGEMYAAKRRSIDLNRLLEQKIDEIIEQKLGSQSLTVGDRDTADSASPFDVETAVQKHADPQKVMNEWFRHEGRKYPKDYGVIFFQGWESYSDAERIDALRDAKKVLDRTLDRPTLSKQKSR